MNKEQLEKQIEDMEAKLQEMKEQLNTPKEFEFTYPYGHSYFVGTFSIGDKCTGTEENMLRNGRYRFKRENAELALQRNKEANLIEALAEQLDPDWVANWEDIDQPKYYIYYHYGFTHYRCASVYVTNSIGIPYMSEETAYKICDMLNNGEFKL